MIKINHLTYTYPQSVKPALCELDWNVADGEFVLVAGPSGSGKSTLLRCLNGLVPHFSGGAIKGEVEVYGLNAISAGPHVLSRMVGFVAQDPESQTVLDRVESEIAFSLENAAVPREEMRVRVEEVLDLLELTSLRGRAVQTLSGGERQRLAIAAALVQRPKVLVLDEPTSQLDPQSAEDVLRTLIRLNEDLGLTIILAEHRLERIARYADRLTWIEEGCIRFDGPVREGLERVGTGFPIIQLARTMGWRPLPLTVKEAKQFLPALLVDKSNMTQSGSTGQTGDIVLEVKNVDFAYNGRPALKNIAMTVRAGEAVALIGRNGAGKSTLLKCIVGLIHTKSGNIRVSGRSIDGRSVADICREVAYLPQNPDDLLFAESVTDELKVTLINHGLTQASGDIHEFLRVLGLAEAAEAYPRDLSVGQRQRVAMGAVTVTRPRLMLLDEPTRGLDASLKAELIALWRKWLADGVAILLVTHDVELAAQIAGRTVMMSQGEVIASGSTREVLGSTPNFAPQISRLLPGRGLLTAADALAYLMN